jgi:hypothetical protein
MLIGSFGQQQGAGAWTGRAGERLEHALERASPRANGVHSKCDARVPCEADAYRSDGLSDRFGIVRELLEQCGERRDHAQKASRAPRGT